MRNDKATPEMPDLFGWSASPAPSVLREEERFGKWDARTGLTLRNHYSSRISGARTQWRKPYLATQIYVVLSDDCHAFSASLQAAFVG